MIREGQPPNEGVRCFIRYLQNTPPGASISFWDHAEGWEDDLDAFEWAMTLLAQGEPIYCVVGGIIWDELKALRKRDYSPAARKALEGVDIDDDNVHTDSQAKFFERVNAAALEMQPDLDISMFVFGHMKGYAVERCARISNTHAFGLDGRP